MIMKQAQFVHFVAVAVPSSDVNQTEAILDPLCQELVLVACEELHI